MSWDKLLQSDVQHFIREHEHEDVHKLGLKKNPNASWPYSLILDQIRVRQKAKTKSPDLYETDSIIFPDNNTYEQASSTACAAYKASLVEGNSFVDLTGGCGVDSYQISKKFKSGVLVERDEGAVALLEHNMRILSEANKTNCEIRVFHGEASSYLQGMGKVDFVFIDPQRREKGSKGFYDLSACSPNIVSLLPVLKEKTRRAMVKTSPILDIERAIVSLGVVDQVHVVQWQGECKEVLYCLDFASSAHTDDVIITSVNINSSGQVQQNFSYKKSDEKKAFLDYAMPNKYIYEPGPAFQKSGGFKSMAIQFNVRKIHQHSHLYTSDCAQEDFPGKIYKVIDVMPAKTKMLNIKRADLVLRNFPGTVENLKRKLKLSDGGDYRIFATTLCDGEKKLIICGKK